MSIKETFTYTGASQSYEISTGGVYKISCKGAGVDAAGRSLVSDKYGGYVEGEVVLFSGDILNIYVGEGNVYDWDGYGGWNGGGDAPGGNRAGTGGAGATDVRLNGESLTDRIIVAGGAGGHGIDSPHHTGADETSEGGAGGADVGEKGNDGTNAAGDGGYGGTQESGGVGANNGQLGIGGDGHIGSYVTGGGGGGGYYGGGGGYGVNTSVGVSAGGGGGSNYISEDFKEDLNISLRGEGNLSHGEIEIELIQQLESLSIRGQVTISENPIENATIRIINQSEGIYIGATKSDAQGNYSFFGLTENDKYHLSVEYEDEESPPNKYNAKSHWDIVATESSIAPFYLSNEDIAGNSFKAVWDTISGTTESIIQLSDDENFNNILENESTTNEFYSFTNLTEINYYWRVKCIQEGKVYSNWSEHTVEIPPWTAPFNLSNEDIVETSFKAVWDSASGTDSFVIQLSDDENFNNILENESTTNEFYSFTNLTEINYYWRVKAVNTGWVDSNWAYHTVYLTSLFTYKEPDDNTNTSWLHIDDHYESNDVAEVTDKLVLAENVGDYLSEGHRISNPYSLSPYSYIDTIDLNWNATEPADTELDVSYLLNEDGDNPEQDFLEFDGTNDYISLPDFTASFTDEASFCMLVKLDHATPSNTGQTGFARLSTSSDTTHYPFTDGSAYMSEFRSNRVNSISLSTEVNRESWHLVTITTTPGTNGWKMYQNTELIHQTTGENSISIDGDNIFLCRNQGNNVFLQGSIKYARIYNRVLSLSEIQDIYQSEALAPTNDLVGYWKLDEGTGTTANDSEGTNDGTITGATWVREEGIWVKATSNESIDCWDSEDSPANKYLWLKQELSTENNQATPELTDLEIELMAAERPADWELVYETGYKFVVPEGVEEVDILVVAGGGAGGCGRSTSYGTGGGAGGGAGGFIEEIGYSVTPEAEISVVVGNGGIGTTDFDYYDNGEDSVFDSLTAIGGGGGDGGSNAASAVVNDGGSGSGVPRWNGSGGEGGEGLQPTSTDGGYGNDGGNRIGTAQGGSGGGGAGGEGTDVDSSTGTSGGVGRDSDITGETITFAEGGNGGNGTSSGTAGADAEKNTGSGGGGGDSASGGTKGGDGGSGIVIVKYGSTVLKYLGDWEAGEYKEGDVVLHNGNTYKATFTTEVEPGTE